jgi:hypothetical protein
MSRIDNYEQELKNATDSLIDEFVYALNCYEDMDSTDLSYFVVNDLQRCKYCVEHKLNILEKIK